MMFSRRILVLTALAGGLLLSANAPARADFVVEYAGVAPSGPNFAHTYNLRFASVAGDFDLRNGDFATIYDIAGLVSATAPAGFSLSTQNVGINAFGTAPTDNPFVANVTFTRTGGTVTADSVFVATVVSTFQATNLGIYTAQETNAVGQTANTPKGNVGFVPVPVPEPISMALLGIGGAAAFGIFRRRQSAAQA